MFECFESNAVIVKSVHCISKSQSISLLVAGQKSLRFILHQNKVHIDEFLCCDSSKSNKGIKGMIYGKQHILEIDSNCISRFQDRELFWRHMQIE